MKFSQKLVCIMLLVIAAFFAVGGAVLVNGSFMDRLSAAAEQEQRKETSEFYEPHAPNS